MTFLRKIIREIYNNCLDEAWSIGYRRCEGDADLFTSSKPEFRVMKPSWLFWYADPIIIRIYGRIYVFMEGYNKWRQKGQIVVSELIGNRLNHPRRIIDEDFHMSFPEVFVYKNQYYMIPETHKISEFRFYVMGKTIYDWTLYKRFKTKGEFSDTCVYVKNDELLMLTTEKKNDNPYMNKLHCFRVDFFDKENTIVKELPIKMENDYDYDIRNAGRIIERGNELYRVIQESEDGYYGKNIGLKRIQELDNNGFCEVNTEEKKFIDDVILKDFEKKYIPVGIHTYGICSGYEVIDIKSNTISLLALYRNARRILRKHLYKE